MNYIIGIDEVGRGPIAGPVAVCAFLCTPGFFDHHPALNTKHPSSERRGGNTLPPLRDSKKLSKIQREKWFEYLKMKKSEGECDYAVSYVSAENIDTFGISKAIKKALETSLYKVTTKAGTPISVSEVSVYLDGGLYAPEEFVHQETIIKGDELHPVISAASIVAKVSRDRIMTQFSKEYPLYGFEKHSGYGTASHYSAIKTHGITPIHRKSFLGKL
jgi:ribonuclease HII